MNVCRGCVYCDSRSECYGFTHPFEDVEVKENAPMLPFLTDSEANFRAILDYCFDAGVKGIVCFNVGMTLRNGDYYQALDRLFPGLKARYAAKYGNAYEVVSDDSERLMRVFHKACERRGVKHTQEDCFRYTSTLPDKNEQLSMF